MILCRQVGWLLAIALLAGCAPALEITSPVPLEPAKGSFDAELPDRSWWRVRFKLRWPEGEQPDFSRHLLIAEQLYMPAIAARENDIPLWRFHRRAARDGAGNQFSFIFFSDQATAEQINAEIAANPLTAWLLEREMIERLRFGSHAREEPGQLEQTADPAWPAEIKRSWPYFIMGVSQSWLMMIQELSDEPALAGTVSYEDLLEHYREVDARLTEQWRDYGQHAYLHHLSAVFGYEPIRLRTYEMRRF